MLRSAISCGVLLALLSVIDAATLTLELAASTSGSGPALSGTRESSVNQTIELPEPGEFKCESFQSIQPVDETFFTVSWDPVSLPNGTVLTLYNNSDCTGPFNVMALFQPTGPFTVVPGTNNSGSATVFGSFLSLNFHVPVEGGVLPDGFYNLYSGPPYNDFQNSYTGCAQYLSGGINNSTVSFAQTDNNSGLQEFLFTLVEAPDMYTISIPRGRNGATALLSAPACDANPQTAYLINATSANATEETTWVLSSVGPTMRSNSNFGFLANITSLARLNNPCPSSNGTSLGVVAKTAAFSSGGGQSCGIEDAAYLIPGASAEFRNRSTSESGGWAVLPVTPAYCYGNPYTQCYPGYGVYSRTRASLLQAQTRKMGLADIARIFQHELLSLLEATDLAALACASKDLNVTVYESPLAIWEAAARRFLPEPHPLDQPATRHSIQAALQDYSDATHNIRIRKKDKATRQTSCKESIYLLDFRGKL
ncbi:hypothetical protein WJX73_003077 [Symbiochloris irregularis]|uniref:Uncharacterized protein n=1 Tax=Symbiochloris irregularis TaxID=706552 RepID=A0AAW1PHR8_9CHLO